MQPPTKSKSSTEAERDQCERAQARAWSRWKIAMLILDHERELAGSNDDTAAKMVNIMWALERDRGWFDEVYRSAKARLREATADDGHELAVTGAREGTQAAGALALRIESMDVYALDEREVAKAALDIILTTSILHDLAPNAPRMGSGTYDRDYAVALDAIEAKVTERLALIREPALAASCGLGAAESELRDKLTDLPRLVLTDVLISMGVEDAPARRFFPKPD